MESKDPIIFDNTYDKYDSKSSDKKDESNLSFGLVNLLEEDEFGDASKADVSKFNDASEADKMIRIDQALSWRLDKPFKPCLN